MLSNSRLRIGIVLVIAAAAFALWGSMAPKRGITEGYKAKDLTLNGINGSLLLSKQTGGIVVLEFTTTWCGYCEGQLNELAKFHAEYEDIIIVSVEIDPRLSAVGFETWVKTKNFDWFVAQSPEAGQDYKISGVPTVLVIDKEGFIRYRGYYTRFDQLKDIVDTYR
jgi:thiol-disulfide isomerase/thioredoxin